MIDIFFTPEYGILNEAIENGKCEVFDFECDYGFVRNIFIKRKINLIIDTNEYFDIVTSYGFGGPFIIEATNMQKLIELYYLKFAEYCSANNIISEFIRFHLFDNIEIREKFYGEVIQLSESIIRDVVMPMDHIWMDFEHKVRKNIKKAISNGLQILIDFDGEHLYEFLSIYNSTMDRNNASKYYYFPITYFQNLHLLLKGSFAYFHVMSGQKIVSSELVLFSDNYVYSFLGGTIMDYYNLRPNDLLKYEIIKWCHETNKKYFVLGGGYHIDDGIYRYKKSFAPNKKALFYIGKKIHNMSVYNQLVDLRKKGIDFDKNTKFFPAYRG